MQLKQSQRAKDLDQVEEQESRPKRIANLKRWSRSSPESANLDRGLWALPSRGI